MSEQLLRNRLREYRKAAGLSVDDLSIRAGVAISTIKEVERGHAPTPSVQRRLASALRLKVVDLFFWEEVEPAEEAV